uniref:Uncharacterized protein n=1 Tax=Lepeophtheirus salmonis TaxID=72036 RepID=A0A0K2VE18_LEPSM
MKTADYLNRTTSSNSSLY